MGSFSLVFIGIQTNLIFIFFAFLIDRFFVATVNSTKFIHNGGTILSVLLGSAFILYFVARSSGIKSWKFHAMLVIPFFTSCIDLTNVIDFSLAPHEWIFPSYVHCEDPVMQSVLVQTRIYLDGTLMHIIHYYGFYAYENGLPWRSTALFTSSIFLVMLADWLSQLLTMAAPLTLLTKFFLVYIPYLIILPILICAEPKSFTFRKEARSFQLMDLITIFLLILTVLITIAKFLISTGVETEILEQIKKVDPTIMFVAVEGAIPVGIIHGWFNIVTVVPGMIISLKYLMTSGKKPEYLWDLALIQAGIILMCSTYSIYGSLHGDLPAKLRANGFDLKFLSVNLIPVIASLLVIRQISTGRDSNKGSVGKIKSK